MNKVSSLGDVQGVFNCCYTGKNEQKTSSGESVSKFVSGETGVAGNPLQLQVDVGGERMNYRDQSCQRYFICGRLKADERREVLTVSVEKECKLVHAHLLVKIPQVTSNNSEGTFSVFESSGYLSLYNLSAYLP